MTTNHLAHRIVWQLYAGHLDAALECHSDTTAACRRQCLECGDINCSYHDLRHYRIVPCQDVTAWQYLDEPAAEYYAGVPLTPRNDWVYLDWTRGDPPDLSWWYVTENGDPR